MVESLQSYPPPNTHPGLANTTGDRRTACFCLVSITSLRLMGTIWHCDKGLAKHVTGGLSQVAFRRFKSLPLAVSNMQNSCATMPVLME